MMADSRLLIGPGGAVQVEELPPPTEARSRHHPAVDV